MFELMILTSDVVRVNSPNVIYETFIVALWTLVFVLNAIFLGITIFGGFKYR